MNQLFNQLYAQRKKNYALANAFITKNNRWLIGHHKDLIKLSPNLLSHSSELNLLIQEKVIFGRRESTSDDLKNMPDEKEKNKAPSSLNDELEVRVKRDRSVTSLQQNEVLQRKQNRNNNVRLTDQYKIAEKYFWLKTLESHHIVEDDIIQKVLDLVLQKCKPDPNKFAKLQLVFKRNNAPCVLLAAEFHRRYINKHISPLRKGINNTIDTLLQKNSVEKKELVNLMTYIRNGFNNLYNGYKLYDLQKLSQIINQFLRSGIYNAIK